MSCTQSWVEIVILCSSPLNQAESEAEQKAEKLLQMPPVMDEREEIYEVLENDNRLESFDQSSFVFTDISTSVTDRVCTAIFFHLKFSSKGFGNCSILKVCFINSYIAIIIVHTVFYYLLSLEKLQLLYIVCVHFNKSST